MPEGASITATTTSGVVTIVAGSKLARKYKWRKCELDARMGARGSRWMGKLGIYDPAPSSGVASYFACEGISRTVVEEAQVHFENEAAAASWLARYARIYQKDTVWTNDGLVVGWAVVPGRDQLNVNVLQLCVGGQRTKSLPEASDAKVSIVGGRRPCTTVAPAVYEETRRTWDAHWKQADEWRARSEARKKAKK